MKSVKELSEELTVSKQTIFNNIKRLNIETIKKENTSFIKNDSDIDKIIQRVFENKKKYGYDNNTIYNNEKNKVENTDTESKENNKMIEILKEQIDTLNEQIKKQENRHESTVEFYRNELQERSKLLENQQILTLESNKKIQKLENELEEERQLNYSFDNSSNDRQNVNAQEANFTEKTKNFNQQEEEKQLTERPYKDIPKEKEGENFNEEISTKDDVQFDEIDSEDEKMEEKQSKKGFWSRLFGN